MDRYADCIGRQIAWLDATGHKSEADVLHKSWQEYARQFTNEQRPAVTTAYVEAYTATRDTLRRGIVSR